MDKIKLKDIKFTPELESFLRKKKVLGKAKENISNYNLYNENDISIHIFDNIGGMFFWNESKEGNNFWNKLEKEFDEENQK